VDVIREAREAIRDGAVPTGYAAAGDGDAESDVAAVEEGD
jgi:hypothetical protein